MDLIILSHFAGWIYILHITHFLDLGLVTLFKSLFGYIMYQGTLLDLHGPPNGPLNGPGEANFWGPLVKTDKVF